MCDLGDDAVPEKIMGCIVEMNKTGSVVGSCSKMVLLHRTCVNVRICS